MLFTSPPHVIYRLHPFSALEGKKKTKGKLSRTGFDTNGFKSKTKKIIVGIVFNSLAFILIRFIF